jgi:hypothetical protein
MTKLADVLCFLRPNDQFVCYGETLEDTVWHNDCVPVTASEYAAGKTAYEKAKKAEETAKATEKAALLAKLGLTADELASLIS